MDISKIDPNLIVPCSIGKLDVRYYDIDSPPFRIYGVWREGNNYYRIPPEVSAKVSPRVHAVRANTTGGRVRFVTDSSYVAIRARIDGIYRISMMSFTGTTGLDMYADGEFVGSFHPPGELQNGGVYESVVNLTGRKSRVITVHMPNYANLLNLEIGLEDGAELTEAPDYRIEKPVVYYGSSITNGGCASRPGMAYPAIISRILDADFRNLGFGGACRGELSLARYIAGLDMSAFVFAYDHNARDPEQLALTHEPFFRAVREENPELPIIIVSRPQLTPTPDREARFAVIERTYANAKASGDRNVYLVRGYSLPGGAGQDFTVDGIHPTDLGFHYMARALAPVIRSAIHG